MDRLQVAAMFAAARGKKVASTMDFFLADQFLNSGIMLEHDRRIRKETIEDMACQIPDTGQNLLDGGSATHWLEAQAKLLE
jgi:hypothetical protein